MRLAALNLALLLAGVYAVAAAASETPTAAVPTATATASGSPVITVYEKPSFQGRALTLARATPDLAPLDFDNRVASLAIQGAGDWVLCEHRNYAGRCVRVQTKAEDLKLLQIGGRVSSLYPVPATPTAPPAPAKP